MKYAFKTAKRQANNKDNILAKNLSDKGVVYKIHKNFTTSTERKQPKLNISRKSKQIALQIRYVKAK